jgi:hypothetical protein
MNNAQVLKTLRNVSGLPALQNAVRAMCGPSGPAMSYEFIFHPNGLGISCFLEVKQPLSDKEMRESGAYGFGNMVCLDFYFLDEVPDDDAVLGSSASNGPSESRHQAMAVA